MAVNWGLQDFHGLFYVLISLPIYIKTVIAICENDLYKESDLCVVILCGYIGLLKHFNIIS